MSKEFNELDLFSTPEAPSTGQHGPDAPQADSYTPLAFRSRPEVMEDFVGLPALVQRYPWLLQKRFPGLILWGPPGSGKTTLALLLAKQAGMDLSRFNAVLGGVAELKKLIANALEMKKRHGLRPMIFIDEIHRFNKAQQDALLPYVEEGEFTLVGATTENPKVSVNRALLSRLRTVELKKPSVEDITSILVRVAEQNRLGLPQEILVMIGENCSGDARQALNALEMISLEHSEHPEQGLEELKAFVLDNARHYDRNADRHYDVISAFIKSVRGSDPQSALLWLAVMLDGGEDPAFIARRLIILASEDIGNADPSALTLAASGLTAVQHIGMPEARLILAQVTTYLASTFKSNASYNAINEAMAYVKDHPNLEVPEEFKSFPREKITHPYQYPHDYPGHFVKRRYNLERIGPFYRPTQEGKEKSMGERLKALWGNQNLSTPTD